MSTLATLPPPAFAPLPPSTSPSAKRPRLALKITVTLAVLGLAFAVFTIASLALFTDSENVGANTFSTGDVNIAALPATAVFTPPAMAPGDDVTAAIDVTNAGSLDLRYALTSTTTEDTLAGELVLTVKVGVTACTPAGWTADGTILYSGIVGSAATAPIFGDATPGADVGDRALAPAASEPLCMNVALPITATNASQNLTTTATFNFEAEQTKNNP